MGEASLGKVDPGALRMVSVLAGGVGGSRQEMCGALSASVLLIGALYGRSQLGEDEERARNLAAKYRHRFLARFGETRCAAIYEGIHSSEGPGSCSRVAEGAAELLLDLLEHA